MEAPGLTDTSEDVKMVQQAVENQLAEQAVQEEHKSEEVPAGKDSKNVNGEDEKNELNEPRTCEKIAPAQDLMMQEETNQCKSLSDQEQQTLKRHIENSENGEEKRQKIEDALKIEDQTNGEGSAGDNPNNVGEDGPKVELTEFTLHEKLIDKLRLRVLSFVDYKTMKTYGKCSKKCREEFQVFEQPYRFEMKEVEDGVVVTMAYKIDARVTSKKFVFSDDDNYEMDNVFDYIMKKLKLSEDDSLEVVINMKHWPTKILNDPILRGSTREWHVTLNTSMYEQFWNLMETIEEEYDEDEGNFFKKLYLNDCDEIDERVVLRREFFKFCFIDDLEKLKISTKFDIDADDFVASNYEHLELTNSNWFDIDALRRKVRAGKSKTDEDITIVLSPDMEQTFDTAQIMDNEPFTTCSEEEVSKKKSYVQIEKSIDGKMLRLKLVYDHDESDESDDDVMDFE